ncbi:MAG: hypothetical protein ACXW5U_27120 [Thermoanaerobaculia bacterium]
MIPPAPLSRTLYIQRVLELYRLMPGTSGHIRRSDRQLAGNFHDRGVSFDIVGAAMLLAAARRTFRSGHPLPPISSLHYIRPLIDELLLDHPPPEYVRYLYCKLFPLAPHFAAAATAHQLS